MLIYKAFITCQSIDPNLLWYIMAGCIVFCWWLTHWGPVIHIYVGKLIISGSGNGMSSGQCEAIIWTNAGILLIAPLGTNFNETLIKIHIFPSSASPVYSQWGAITLPSSILFYDILYSTSVTERGHKSEFKFIKDAPYLAIMGALWDVYWEKFEEIDHIIMALYCILDWNMAITWGVNALELCLSYTNPLNCIHRILSLSFGSPTNIARQSLLTPYDSKFL